MEIGTLIWGEKRAEAGNMMVSSKVRYPTPLIVADKPVCGSPQFELCVRQALRSIPFEIALMNNVFQPDETWTSQSAARYNAKTRKPIESHG